eukprot:145487-Rhodomonas_salina.1
MRWRRRACEASHDKRIAEKKPAEPVPDAHLTMLRKQKLPHLVNTADHICLSRSSAARRSFCCASAQGPIESATDQQKEDQQQKEEEEAALTATEQREAALACILKDRLQPHEDADESSRAVFLIFIHCTPNASAGTGRKCISSKSR